MEAIIGLDMYLTAEQYFFSQNKGAPVVDGHRVSTVMVQAAYWRKSNQIHDWFVKNVQQGADDCKSYSVDRETLRQLISICKEVQSDHSLAAKLLPPKPGFFFGNTDYDDWYLHGLTQTITQVEKALKSFDVRKWDFSYRSSW